MLDEYTDEFSTNLDKHTAFQPQPQPQVQSGLNQPGYTGESHPQYYQQPQPQIIPQQQPQYQAPIYQQHVYQQPVFQTPTPPPAQPLPSALPPNAYQPPQENTRINNVFGEESKELNELLKAEQNGGCLKTGMFILLCLFVVAVSFWASFTLGTRIFFPDNQKLKNMLPPLSKVTHKVKNMFSTSDIVKVNTEFKHDLAAEPTTPILPPEVRPQPLEVKPRPAPVVQAKPRPKPLAPAVARAANPPLKKGMYRVIAGAYTTRKEAEDVLANIKADGFESYIYGADGKYRIQIGAFKTKAAAEDLRKKALEYGYNAFVSIY